MNTENPASEKRVNLPSNEGYSFRKNLWSVLRLKVKPKAKMNELIPSHDSICVDLVGSAEGHPFLLFPVVSLLKVLVGRQKVKL